MLLRDEKMGLDTKNSTQVNGNATVIILGQIWGYFMIRFSPKTSQFLHRFRWLTPHFEGNYNIFLSNTILLKTSEFEIFMNMPTLRLKDEHASE